MIVQSTDQGQLRGIQCCPYESLILERPTQISPTVPKEGSLKIAATETADACLHGLKRPDSSYSRVSLGSGRRRRAGAWPSLRPTTSGP